MCSAPGHKSLRFAWPGVFNPRSRVRQRVLWRYMTMKWLRRILTVVFTALLLFSAYKINEYVREARESEASVETLIEKAVEERTPKEPGSLCAFLKTC